MDQLRLQIDGMSCGHCVSAVKRALEGVGGVQVEQVQVGSAVVRYDPQAVSTQAIAQAVEDEGYAVTGTGPAAA